MFVSISFYKRIKKMTSIYEKIHNKTYLYSWHTLNDSCNSHQKLLNKNCQYNWSSRKQDKLYINSRIIYFLLLILLPIKLILKHLEICTLHCPENLFTSIWYIIKYLTVSHVVWKSTKKMLLLMRTENVLMTETFLRSNLDFHHFLIILFNIS